MPGAPELAAESSHASIRPPHHHRMHWAMLGAVCCWAANMVAVKEALLGFNPLALTLIRAIAAGLVFWVLFCVLRGRSLPRLSRRQWLYLAVMAFVGVTLGQLFFILGVAWTSVPHAALIVAIGPVMVLVLSVILRMERLTVLKCLGTVLSFSGVAVLTHGKAGPGGHPYRLGDLIMLCQATVFAVYTIMMKEVVDQYDGLTLNTLVFGLGAVMLIPFGVSSVWRVDWSHIPERAVLGLGFMTFFSSVIAYVLFMYALSRLTASRVAAFSYVEPVVATGLGIWLLNDKLNLSGVLGGVLILLGVYLAEQERGESPVNSTAA